MSADIYRSPATDNSPLFPPCFPPWLEQALHVPTCSNDGVAAVDAQVGAGDVGRGVAGEKDDGAFEVVRVAEARLGDERRPLVAQGRVVVQDLLGPVSRRGKMGASVSAYLVGWSGGLFRAMMCDVRRREGRVGGRYVVGAGP